MSPHEPENRTQPRSLTPGAEAAAIQSRALEALQVLRRLPTIEEDAASAASLIHWSTRKRAAVGRVDGGWVARFKCEYPDPVVDAFDDACLVARMRSLPSDRSTWTRSDHLASQLAGSQAPAASPTLAAQRFVAAFRRWEMARTDSDAAQHLEQRLAFEVTRLLGHLERSYEERGGNVLAGDIARLFDDALRLAQNLELLPVADDGCRVG